MKDDSDDDINENIRLLMRFIADLSVDVATCRAVLRGLGISDEEYEETKSILKAHWEPEAQAEIDRVAKSRRTAEALRKLLESPEDPKH